MREQQDFCNRPQQVQTSTTSDIRHAIGIGCRRRTYVNPLGEDIPNGKRVRLRAASKSAASIAERRFVSI